MPNNNAQNEARLAWLASIGVGVNSTYRNGTRSGKGWGLNPAAERPPIDMQYFPPGGPAPLSPETKALLRFDTDATDEVGTIWTPTGAVSFSGGKMVADGGYLRSATDIDLEIGTGDFTMEYTLSNAIPAGQFANYTDFRSASNKGLAQYVNNANPILVVNDAASIIMIGQTVCMGAGLTHRICLERVNGVLTQYVDGVYDTAAVYAQSISGPASVTLGANYVGTQPAKGSFDDFELTVGRAKYGGPYTPA